MPLTLEESLIKQNQKFENKKYLQALKAQQEAAAQSAGLAQQRFQDIPVNQRPRLSSALMSDDSYAPALSQYVGQADYVPLANRIQADFQRGDAEKERLQNLMKNVKYLNPDKQAVLSELERYQIPEELTDDRFAYKKVGNLANEFYQNINSNQHILGKAKENYLKREAFAKKQKEDFKDSTSNLAEYNIRRFDERYAQSGGLTGPDGYDPNADYRGNMLDYNYQYAPEDPELNKMVIDTVKGWRESGGKWKFKNISLDGGKQIGNGDEIAPSANGYIVKHAHGGGTTQLTYEEVYGAVSRAMMQNEQVREYVDFVAGYRADNLAKSTDEYGRSLLELNLEREYNQYEKQKAYLEEQINRATNASDKARLEEQLNDIKKQQAGLEKIILSGDENVYKQRVAQKEKSNIVSAAFNLGAEHQSFKKTESFSEYDAVIDQTYFKGIEKKAREALASRPGQALTQDPAAIAKNHKDLLELSKSFKSNDWGFIKTAGETPYRDDRIEYYNILFDELNRGASYEEVNKIFGSLTKSQYDAYNNLIQGEGNVAGLDKSQFANELDGLAQQYNNQKKTVELAEEQLENYRKTLRKYGLNDISVIESFLIEAEGGISGAGFGNTEKSNELVKQALSQYIIDNGLDVESFIKKVKSKGFKDESKIIYDNFISQFESDTSLRMLYDEVSEMEGFSVKGNELLSGVDYFEHQARLLNRKRDKNKKTYYITPKVVTSDALSIGTTEAEEWQTRAQEEIGDNLMEIFTPDGNAVTFDRMVEQLNENLDGDQKIDMDKAPEFRLTTSGLSPGSNSKIGVQITMRNKAGEKLLKTVYINRRDNDLATSADQMMIKQLEAAHEAFNNRGSNEDASAVINKYNLGLRYHANMFTSLNDLNMQRNLDADGGSITLTDGNNNIISFPDVGYSKVKIQREGDHLIVMGYNKWENKWEPTDQITGVRKYNDEDAGKLQAEISSKLNYMSDIQGLK